MGKVLKDDEDNIIVNSDEFLVTNIDLAAFLDREYGIPYIRSGNMPSRRNPGQRFPYFVFKDMPATHAAAREFRDPKKDRTKIIMNFRDGQKFFRQVKANAERHRNGK